MADIAGEDPAETDEEAIDGIAEEPDPATVGDPFDSLDDVLERGSIDRENAVFVLLGVLLTAVVVARFLQVLG